MNRPREVEYDGSEIAICGMAGRFPGAADVSEFWRNLREGVESITSFTKEEVLAGGEEPELVDDPNYVKARSVIDGVERFDAAFFGFAPREAEVLDPQERLLLECIWEALEHAGYDTQRPGGTIGLFAGAPMSTYLVHHLYRNRPTMKAFGDVETTVYNSPGMVATFAAYKLNLKGACCSVQTFCSTSLVAVHLACQSLLNYENDIAIAGGVTVFAPQQRGYLFQEGGIVSPDGKCRVFDADAAGTVFGNGAGAVVLKRLKDAIAEGDTIHAVIRGSAINNDGALKVSYAAPSVVGQTEVIVEALSAAGVDPETIGYVEAHGTGTRLGDPAEIEALTKAFRTKTTRKRFCAIGSVKSNVGHLDAAAGITGLIKTVLCLKHGEIPPSLHCRKPNPLIDFENSPFYVNTSLAEWKAGPHPRRASVSAFGIGGTNAHVVLEEAPVADAGDSSRPAQLLLLSAKTLESLDQATQRLGAWLRENPEANLADVAYTLQVGRREFNHRRMLVCDSAVNAAAVLASADPTQVLSVHQVQRNPPVVFVFPDRGAAGVNTARDLYDHDRAFRKEVDSACELSKRLLGVDVRPGLYPIRPAGEPSPALEGFTGALAVFIVELALARLWISWGVRPAAIVGSGVGEWAAACAAGVCSLETGLALLARASGQLPQAMQPAGMKLSPPQVPLLSGETGAVLSLEEATSADRLSSAPGPGRRLQDAIQALRSDSRKIVLEIGPASLPLADETFTLLPPSDHSGADVHHMLRTLGLLWLAGLEIAWPGFYRDEHRRRVPLPTYAFDRKRFWIDPILDEDDEAPKAVTGKNPDTVQWIYAPTWRSSVAPGAPIADDRRPCLVFVDSRGVGTSVVERLRQAGREVVTVAAGDADRGDPAVGYAVNPRSPQSYTRLIADLARLGKIPGTIVHAWLVDTLDGFASEKAEFDEALDRGFFSLIYLTDALARQPGADAVRLKIVSSQVHDLTGSEPLNPAKAPALALCHVIQQEHHNIRCSAIDIEVPDAHRGIPARLQEALLAEVLADCGEPLVVYRGNTRWLQGFAPVQVPPADNTTGRLRQDGAYVIIGGLGNVGMVIAACLATWVRAKLIVIGRSAVPPPAEWTEWLATHAPQEPTSLRIRKLKALQSMGAEVVAISADTTDVAQMRAAFAHARECFGRIDGVVHCAGVLSSDTFQPIRQLTRDICEQQFAPKVRGLQVLEEALGDMPLDFCLLTSSLSTVLGGLGYGAYAAANMFMDAFAAARNRTSDTPWITVDWDQWRFDDSTTPGLTAGSTLEALAMLPQEGAAVLGHVLRVPAVRQFVISTSNLDSRIATWVRLAGAAQPERKRASAEFEHIESVIVAHPAVKEAVVVAESSSGDRRLIAHVLFEPGASLTNSELRRHAKEQLAADQVPSFFITLDRTHLGSDGRIDRSALSSPFEQTEGVPEDEAAPRTSTERRIAAIWRDALGVERVRVHDNFFDIGGHSLLSVRVIARIESVLGHRLDFRVMFLESLEQIAARCDRHLNGASESTSDVAVAEVGLR